MVVHGWVLSHIIGEIGIIHMAICSCLLYLDSNNKGIRCIIPMRANNCLAINDESFCI